MENILFSGGKTLKCSFKTENYNSKMKKGILEGKYLMLGKFNYTPHHKKKNKKKIRKVKLNRPWKIKLIKLLWLIK